MFAQIHLWELGVLLIGVAFVVGGIYLGKTLKNMAKAIDDIDEILQSNKQSIDAIVSEVENITKSTSVVMEDVQQSVGSLKQTVYNAEKTVSATKNYVLKPVYKSLNYTHILLKVINKIMHKKRKRT
ncbi:MAG: DUF948 domain-containing protein [Eubacteriales bacterium]